MNSIQLFSHELFGDIRIVDQEGQPWFVAKDISDALGYENSRDAIIRYCKGVEKLDTLKKGGHAQSIIPESDLFRLIMRSKLPAAEQFQDWVVEEILPSIRKTGSYGKTAGPSIAAVALAKAVGLANSAAELLKLADMSAASAFWPTEANVASPLPDVGHIPIAVKPKRKNSVDAMEEARRTAICDMLELVGLKWLTADELLDRFEELGVLCDLPGSIASTRAGRRSCLGKLLHRYEGMEWRAAGGEVLRLGRGRERGRVVWRVKWGVSRPLNMEVKWGVSRPLNMEVV
ncbi:MAG: BRO family protein [Verrucomicrobiota bacterium]